MIHTTAEPDRGTPWRTRLTPGALLGWRVAEYLREFFDGLDGVRVAAPEGSDQAAALRDVRTESGLPLDLVHSASGRGWDALAYHPATGTVLEFHSGLVPHGLPADRDAAGEPAGFEQEQHEDDEDDEDRAATALLVRRLVELPLERCCRIRERVVVRSRCTGEGGTAIRCHRCGAPVARSDRWQDQSVLCCPACTGLEPCWVVQH